MTQTTTHQASHQGVINSKTLIQLFLLVLLTILADWLFFDQNIGLSLPLFLLTLGLSAYVVRKNHDLNVNKIELVIPFLAVLPAIETFNWLTAAIGILGIIIFTLKVNANLYANFFEWGQIAKSFIISAPFRLLEDLPLFKRWFEHTGGLKGKYSQIISVSALPIVLSLGFVMLFALANPLIGQWIEKVDFFYPLKHLNINRLLFCIITAIICWPLLRVSAKIYAKPKRKNQPSVPTTKETKTPSSQFLNRYLGNTSVLQSLIMFNVLFGVQTYLDMLYLWGDGTLPIGLSHSQYVHKGTYVLLLTALLAAAFILLILRQSREQSVSKLTKGLLYIWTVQNIILVLSTMRRMGLYVEAYSLTYLRVAVLIWIMLVIIGLGLILVRLFQNRPNIWLVKANIISVALLLYITSLVNLPYIISQYNVNVAIENPSKKLDLKYLIFLGHQALPAIKKAANLPQWQHTYVKTNHKSHHLPYAMMGGWAYVFERDFLQSPRDWRQWNFRDHRLKQYLSNNEQKPH